MAPVFSVTLVLVWFTSSIVIYCVFVNTLRCRSRRFRIKCFIVQSGMVSLCLRLQVYCRKHIADIKVPLDLPDKDSQLGPQTYKEAHERISPKLLVYVPVAQAGPGKVGKSGRAVGKDKQASLIVIMRLSQVSRLWFISGVSSGEA